MPSNQEKVRQQILHKLLENSDLSSAQVSKSLKVSIRTVQRVKKSWNDSQSVRRKTGSGKNLGASDINLDRTIVRTIKGKRSTSIRDIAKKVGTSTSMVQRAKKRNGLRTYKKQKNAKKTENQLKTIKTRLRKLYNILLEKKTCIVMDDETYVKMDFSTLPGPQYYTKQRYETLPESQTNVGVEKFGAKLLVWQAICQCGQRSRLFVTSGTINGENYRKECLEKRLIPFIKSHKGSTLFWPDLASAHYAKKTLELLEAANVQYVQKEANPPNVPELRPIERFWALVKRELKKDSKPAKDIEKFKVKWTRASARITNVVVQNLMAGIIQKVRLAIRNE